MSGEEPVSHSGSPGVPRPSEAFSAYCNAEFDRRRNSGETFDEATYREAMQLALSKIERLEEEGYA
ncbi:nodulation protein E [Sedimenticola hydrogenitrophicus]|uniref:nodulation protein E n=1 Tax=Sedimenticola hydrogenitrophicus TaxID=2967975 RepID=UPI0021A74288|nr:nodulation protein E [Sedimenticola hydrogenitrophicus]